MSIRDLVDNIAAGKKGEASSIFQDAMMDKIQDAIEVERVKVAANFLQPQVEEEVEFEADEEITEEVQDAD
jgi:hypothetical protein